MEKYTQSVYADFNMFYLAPVDSTFDFDFFKEDFSTAVEKDGVVMIPLPGDPTDQTVNLIFSSAPIDNLPDDLDEATYDFTLPVDKPLIAINGLYNDRPKVGQGTGFAIAPGTYSVKVFFKFAEEDLTEDEFDAGLGATTCYLEFTKV